MYLINSLMVPKYVLACEIYFFNGCFHWQSGTARTLAVFMQAGNDGAMLCFWLGAVGEYS